jgi:two-component system sensor histidine kinase BarA
VSAPAPGDGSGFPTGPEAASTDHRAASEREPTGPDLDDAVDLRDLLPATELDELVARFASASGGGVAVLDRRGHVLAARAGAVPSATRDVCYNGEVLGTIVVGGEQGERFASLFAEVLGLILHHAHARHLTSAAHQAAMEQAFAELTAKNQRLETAVTRMQELDRLKSNFLATMSHELRTPLTSVIGYAEMLLEGLAGPLGDEQRDYVHTILAKADHLLQLITSLLDVSLLESGTRAVEAGEVGLAEVVDSVVASFAPQAQKRGILVEVQARSLRALGDRRKIRQVLWSLVSNAVKFSRDRERVRVEIGPGLLVPVELGGHPRGAWGAHVVVRDSGIGISRDQLAHIFEPFFQVDSSSTREYGGSGLGLTLAKAYVEAHGGRIWVDSTLGEGSTFTVSFPAVAEDVAGALAAHGAATG